MGNSHSSPQTKPGSTQSLSEPGTNKTQHQVVQAETPGNHGFGDHHPCTEVGQLQCSRGQCLAPTWISINELLRTARAESRTRSDVRVPELTKPAPDFIGTAVVGGQFKEIKLSDYAGKYLVLFFYPLDFTFVCPTELISFSDRADEFRDIGCSLVACSTDSHFSHLAWINSPRKEGGLGRMSIPLLADKNCQIAKDYGVYKEDDGVAFRGLFIIDDKGLLRQVTVNDLPVGRSVDETLRLVQAFQYTDENGEVCPADWKPGDVTMKPDPEGSKTYFETQN